MSRPPSAALAACIFLALSTLAGSASSTWRMAHSTRRSSASMDIGKYKRLHQIIDAASLKCLADSGKEVDAMRAHFEMQSASDADLNVTVVIGSYARPEMLRHIVEALSRQKFVSVTAIIADAGSPSAPDEQPDVLLRYKDDGKYHRVRSFNDAVQLARTDHVILLDDDTIPLTSFWAATHVRRLVQEPGGFTRGLVNIFMADANVTVNEKILRQAASIDWPRSALGWFSTTNFGFNRSTWRSVGGFYQAFDGNHGFEDHDLGLTVEAAGLPALVLPTLSCALHPSVHYAKRNIPRPKDRSINKAIMEAKWNRSFT